MLKTQKIHTDEKKEIIEDSMRNTGTYTHTHKDTKESYTSIYIYIYFINPFFKDEVNEETETARILKEYSFLEKKSFI